MTGRSAVFGETLQNYIREIMALPKARLMRVHQLESTDTSVTIPFFNRLVTITETGFAFEDGSPVPFEIAVILAKYLLLCPESPYGDTAWVSFKDFRDSGPLTVYFSDNVEKPIIRTFADHPDGLDEACRHLEGFPPDSKSGLFYDLVMAFQALPGIRILLLYNRAEDVFPAHCSVLFEARAERYLDPESLAILAAVFARSLCRNGLQTPLP
jgi:hypothetical protein